MNHQENRKAIEALFARLDDAWNKGDGEAFGLCFTEDADYVTFMGQHLKGRKQIAEVHQRLFDGLLKGSVMTANAASDVEPRFLTAEVAIVHRVGEVQLAGAAKDATDRKSMNTNVVVKQHGEWKITAFHNCRIQPLPQGGR